jgi:hypothetical protein
MCSWEAVAQAVNDKLSAVMDGEHDHPYNVVNPAGYEQLPHGLAGNARVKFLAFDLLLIVF